MAGFSLVSKLGLGILVWLANRAAVWHPDSASYQNTALNLLYNGRFSRATAPPLLPEVFRTPGYPLVLAGTYGLFGPTTLPVVILQSLCATATVALTWALGRRLFGARVGFWAAAVLCLDIASICSCQLLMSETLFALLVLLAFWCYLRGPEHTGFYALSGLALACAVHVRPIGYYLVPVAAVGVVIQAVRGRLRPVRSAIAFLAAPLLLVGGWQAYNLHRTGVARFSSIEGLNMYFYRAGGVVSLKTHRPLFEVHREMGLETERTDFSGYLAQRPEYRATNPAVMAERWQRDGIRTLLANPGWLAVLQARSTAALLLDPGTFTLATLAGFESDARGQELLAGLQQSPAAFFRGLLRDHRGLFLVSLWGLAYLVLLYAGIGRWLARAQRRDWSAPLVAAAAVVLYFVVISAGPEAASRFRVPGSAFRPLSAAAGSACNEGGAAAAARRPVSQP